MAFTEEELEGLKGKSAEELLAALTEKEDELDALAGTASLTEAERVELEQLRTKSASPKASPGKTQEPAPDGALQSRLDKIELDLVKKEIAAQYPKVKIEKIKGKTPEELLASAKELNEIAEEAFNKGKEEATARGKESLLTQFSGLTRLSPEVDQAPTYTERVRAAAKGAPSMQVALRNACTVAARELFSPQVNKEV